MFQYDEGIGMARSVIEINQKTPIIGRGYLALGIGCCCKASTGKLYIVLCTVGWGNRFIFNTLYVSHSGYDFINNTYDILPRNNLSKTASKTRGFCVRCAGAGPCSCVRIASTARLRCVHSASGGARKCVHVVSDAERFLSLNTVGRRRVLLISWMRTSIC